MRNNTLLCSLVLSAIIWASCRPAVVPDDYVPVHSTAVLTGILDSIVHDSVALRRFCEDWNRILPNRDAYIQQNDTIAALYAVFEAYFMEKRLDTSFDQYRRFSKWYYLEKTDAYLLIPRKLRYDVQEIRDTVYEYPALQLDTLHHFRPPMTGIKARCLYLTPEFAEALNTYLGYNDPDLKKTWITSSEDSVLYNKYMHFNTRKRHLSRVIGLNYPEKLAYVCLNPSLNVAHLHFSAMGGGSAALFKKTQDRWVFQREDATWVE
jgi:hypothetical protein